MQRWWWPGFAPRRSFAFVLCMLMNMSILHKGNGRNGVANTAQPNPKPHKPTKSPKSDMVTMMTHELRTPLHAMLGFAQLLLDPLSGGELSADQQHQIELILRSGRHLADLIDALMDIALAHSGQMAVHPSRVAPAEMIEEVCAELGSLAYAKAQQVHITIPSPLPSMALDPHLLREILTNLLGNAIKFAPSASTIEVGAQHGPAGTVEFFVRDQGPGILKKQQRAIFKPFTQVTTDATVRRQGNGLGLALTRQFVRLQHGTIWVESAAHKGSTFWVRLPIGTPEENG